MVNIDELTEAQFDALIDKVGAMLPTLATEALSENDPQAYDRLAKLYNDEDYELSIALREVLDTDEYDDELGDKQGLICAEFMLVAKDGTLKNDVHLVDIIFNADIEEEPLISASWFHEN